jgi:hypothetical protein
MNRVESGTEHAEKCAFRRPLCNFPQIKKAANSEKIDMENGKPCKDFCDKASQHFVARSVHGKAIQVLRK